MQVKPVQPAIVTRVEPDAGSGSQHPGAQEREAGKKKPEKAAATAAPPAEAPLVAPTEVTNLKSEDFLQLLENAKASAPPPHPFAEKPNHAPPTTGDAVKNLDRKA